METNAPTKSCSRCFRIVSADTETCAPCVAVGEWLSANAQAYADAVVRVHERRMAGL